MKVLIVEDELLARAGLRSLIDWNMLGFTLLEDARDGREALERIEQQKPDILLLDLNIPEISGLELLEIIKNRGISVRTIVISCYDDFNTVKEAMKLGAADYIRKFGLSGEELTDALSGMIRKPYEAKTKSEQSVAQRRQEDRQRLLNIPEKFQTGSCLSFYIRRNDWESLVDMEILENIVRQYYQKTGRELLCLFYEGKMLALSHEPAEAWETDGLHRQIRLFIPDECCIGVTDCRGFGEEEKFFLRIANTIEHYAFYTPEAATFYFNRPMVSPKKYAVGMEDIRKKLKVKIDAISETEILESINSMFDRIDENRYVSIYLVKRLMIEMLGYFSGRAEKLGGSIEDIETDGSSRHYQKIVGLNSLKGCREWWKEFVKCFAARFFILQKSSESDIMERTLNYIEANLYKTIQLSDAARYIGVSEPYLSSFFKKNMHENFIPYVNRRKVECGKKLLEEGKMVYQVSELLGYENSTYFSKVFKKVEGITPEQFRKKFLSVSGE